jgi:SAM-dependent methyltransferase
VKNFGDYAAYYDLLYADKNYGLEADFVATELRSYAPNAQRLADLGCGTGAHALNFASAGFHVDGFDLSPEMLAIAHQRRSRMPAELQARLHFALGDIRHFRSDRHYDAATALFHVMSYQTQDIDVRNAIQSVRKHLSAGSPFLFDFWHGPGVISNAPTTREKTAENAIFRVVRAATPAWQRAHDVVHVQYHVTVVEKSTGRVLEFEESHSMRYFFVEQLQAMLAQGGFRLEKAAEWLTNAPATGNCFSAYAVAIAE